ncbi:CatB-related O-acetyltransferase [Aeromicrobium sp.]|uniref:CatB-related O-acetyltransferase n=1 Tax=Aeromicrobium sp. TaxID=1871063 RepID=UPI0019A8B92A|nr:CatB-related O-acetyltransferase [Aeromicrobium sp.]MBC7632140.1 CatB-related O-acetyltransferase [Aeromicrobium sp.]
MDQHVRGGQHVQRIGGSRLFVEPPVRFLGPFVIRADTHIGAFTEFGREVEMQAATIGRYCEVGPGSLLGATGHPTTWLSISAFQYRRSTWGWHPSADAGDVIDPEAGGRQSFRSVAGDVATIGNDVWIGANVVVLRGVTIGDGAIVAANAVVTKDIPPYAIAGGIPAKVIRPRVADDLRDELLVQRWWRFSPNQLTGITYDDPATAVAELRPRIDAGLEPYDPGDVEVSRQTPTKSESPTRRWRRLLRR